MTSLGRLTVFDNVSRETLERLKTFERLLSKWTAAINLVSRSASAELWTRHFADSAQIFTLCPPKCKAWADLGTGGGFPGLVVAILAAETRPEIAFTMVESDQRKATFLRQVLREAGLEARIVTDRIESALPLGADVISARALAPMTVLCGYSLRHGSSSAVSIYMKGAKYADDLAEARLNWRFDHEIRPSQTDASAVILKITNIRPR